MRRVPILLAIFVGVIGFFGMTGSFISFREGNMAVIDAALAANATNDIRLAVAPKPPGKTKKIQVEPGEMCRRMITDLLQTIVMDSRYKGVRGKVLDCAPISLIGFRPWRIFQCSLDLGPNITLITLPQQVHCDGIFKEYGVPAGSSLSEQDLEDEPMKSPFPNNDAVENEKRKTQHEVRGNAI